MANNIKSMMSFEHQIPNMSGQQVSITPEVEFILNKVYPIISKLQWVVNSKDLKENLMYGSISKSDMLRYESQVREVMGWEILISHGYRSQVKQVCDPRCWVISSR